MIECTYLCTIKFIRNDAFLWQNHGAMTLYLDHLLINLMKCYLFCFMASKFVIEMHCLKTNLLKHLNIEYKLHRLEMNDLQMEEIEHYPAQVVLKGLKNKMLSFTNKKRSFPFC